MGDRDSERDRTERDRTERDRTERDRSERDRSEGDRSEREDDDTRRAGPDTDHIGASAHAHTVAGDPTQPGSRGEVRGGRHPETGLPQRLPNNREPRHDHDQQAHHDEDDEDDEEEDEDDEEEDEDDEEDDD
jgi:hypothetical protein